jgi:DNA-binding LytR/AlgR family response regulator
VEGKIKALIVDDEFNSRSLMSKMLETFDDISVLGSASSADEGISMVLDKKPDLLFLDISMPGKDGFDLVTELKNAETIPDIIFVTAFDQFAIQAFKVSAFDYLLKPVDIDALEETIERYRLKKNGSNLQSKIDVLIEQISGKKTFSKITVPTRTGVKLFDPEEIVFCEAEGNYTLLTTTNGERSVITHNIGKVEEMLTGDSFFRTSRSYLINLNHLAGFDRKTKSLTLLGGDKQVVLSVPLKALKKLDMYIK